MSGDKTPVCKKHDKKMIKRKDPRTGEVKDPVEWACGQCAIDMLFAGRGDNYIAEDIKRGGPGSPGASCHHFKAANTRLNTSSYRVI